MNPYGQRLEEILKATFLAAHQRLGLVFRDPYRVYLQLLAEFRKLNGTEHVPVTPEVFAEQYAQLDRASRRTLRRVLSLELSTLDIIFMSAKNLTALECTAQSSLDPHFFQQLLAFVRKLQTPTPL